MKKIKYIISGLLLLISVFTFAQNQNPLVRAVYEAKESDQRAIEITDILQPATNFRSSEIAKSIKEAHFFNYNVDAAKRIIESSSDFISIKISPDDGRRGAWTLDLIEAPESFYDYTVTTSSGEEYHASDFKGRHYRGVIRGMEEESIVAISFFQNEMMGIISTNREGNFNLGKIRDRDTHILYKDADRINPSSPSCDTHGDDAPGYDKDVLMNNSSMRSSNDKCVDVYFEVENDIFQTFGNLSATQNYVAGLFNQASTLYLAENIVTVISTILVWDIQDPYNGSNAGELLSQFQSETDAINGDLGQLLTFRNIGGGKAAGFDGLCNTDVDERLSVAGVGEFFSTVPFYSEPVMMVTHELGHLLGSRHTHACVWNGNDTQIDDCGNLWADDNNNTPEGDDCYNSSNPIIPMQGGTMMSYCHVQNNGINFSFGFGTQPGNVIRNTVNNANCLTSCCPTHKTIFQNITGGNAVYEALWTVNGSSEISGGANITFSGGMEVNLTPGFWAKGGSSFHGYIYGCGGSGSLISNADEIDEVEEEITPTISEEPKQELEKPFSELKVYPNPFSDITTIEYEITDDNLPVTISIFNMVGKRISILSDNEVKAKGIHKVTFDGSTLPPGMYYCHVKIGDQVSVKKMILTK